MDLIHSLSNLEIETHHPHSSSSKKEEEEVKRNWLALPADVMSLILLKLGHVDIIGIAERVCSSWEKLSKQPHLFHCINVEEVVILAGHRLEGLIISRSKVSEVLAREAIDRSCGQLVEFSVKDIATDELMLYMSEKSSSLRCLRLISCEEVSDGGLIETAKKLRQLEELELIHCSFSEDVIKTFGRLCPNLKSCRLNYLSFMLYRPSYMLNRTARAVAETMPELRHLNLFGNSLTGDGLRAILHGCPHLQTVDLRECFNLKFEGELKDIMSAANIKLKLPSDSTDDFEYAPVDNYNDYLDEDSDFYYYGVML